MGDPLLLAYGAQYHIGDGAFGVDDVLAARRTQIDYVGVVQADTPKVSDAKKKLDDQIIQSWKEEHPDAVIADPNDPPILLPDIAWELVFIHITHNALE